MLLLQIILLGASASCILAASKPVSVQIDAPYDLLGPQAEELRRVRPLAFNPADGINFRREFEQQHGYRGERLIAKLGAGPTPLSIYDASLIKESTAIHAPVPTVSPPQSTTTVPEDNDSSSVVKSTTASIKPRGYVRKLRRDDNSPVSTKRKYQDIRKKVRKTSAKRYLNKSDVTEPTPTDEDSTLIKNSISSSRKVTREDSAVVEPDSTPSEEEKVQKRLYRAIWNHGLRGLTEGEADSISGNLRNLESFAQPNFNQLDLAQQLSGAIDLSRQLPFSQQTSNSAFGVNNQQLPLSAFRSANNGQQGPVRVFGGANNGQQGPVRVFGDANNGQGPVRVFGDANNGQGPVRVFGDSSNGQSSVRAVEDNSQQSEVNHEFRDAENSQSPQDAQLLRALAAAGEAVDSQQIGQIPIDQLNEPTELGEPSLPQYAGLGEPSLLVTSYSYSEVLQPPGFGGTPIPFEGQNIPSGQDGQNIPSGQDGAQIASEFGGQDSNNVVGSEPNFNDPNNGNVVDSLGGGSELHLRRSSTTRVSTLAR